jgi:Raf kinase inhibitor-like YbhB/YbcL family protein
MKLISAATLLAVFIGVPAALAAPAIEDSLGGLAISQLPPPAKKALTVSSPKIPSGGAIPDAYSSYGKSVSPPLAWSKGPYGTRSFAIVLEDPDAPTPVPFQHWLVWNIPGTTTGLAEGVLPAGAEQGSLMILNKAAYFGPRPPPGPAHHYHFQVFALDRQLDLKPGSDRGALADAMKGHVLASGELVATYQKK